MNTHARQDPPKHNSQLTSAWRHALMPLVLLLGWIMFLYRDTGIAMVTIWSRSDTFTHAYLVPPISLWLIWRQRSVLLAQTPHSNYWTLAAIFCAAFVWLLGDLAAVNAVTQLALVALLVLTTPAILGLAVTRLIIFPLAFLFFAVPIGEFLMPQLMAWTADFTVLALRLSGIPVYREGLQFVIPSGTWSVVEACSGVRYLIASLTVGTLFAHLNFQSTQRRVLFIIVSILMPVLANWLRAYLIVILGHFSGNKLAAGVDHLVYGWFFFGIVIILMFIIGARWSESEKTANFNALSEPSIQQPLIAARLWISSVCFAALVTFPLVALWAIDRAESGSTVALTAPPALAADWHADPVATPSFKPAFQSPSAEINRQYVSQGHKVGIYLAYYRQQDYSHKLVSSNNALVLSKDPQWIQVASGRSAISVAGSLVAVRTAELRGSDVAGKIRADSFVVWQIYWINGILTTSDYSAKVYSAFYRLIGRGDDSAVIIAYTTKTDQAERAETVLASFLTTNYATINALLRNARQPQ